MISSALRLDERSETTKYRKMTDIRRATPININAFVVSSPGRGSNKLSIKERSGAFTSAFSSDAIVLKDSVPVLEETISIESVKVGA